MSVDAILREPSSTINTSGTGFRVPTILSFELKKKTTERPKVEIENIRSRQNGNKNPQITTEENEDLRKMPPRKKEMNYKNSPQKSSFLLEPFLNPVQPHESNKENPVVKALFGGRNRVTLSAWNYATRTTLNNCHPFKKTEFSHDLSSDDTPVQIPKSLSRKTSKARKSSPKRDSIPEKLQIATKETPKILTPANQTRAKSPVSQVSVSLRQAPGVAAPAECSILDKRKRVIAQASVTNTPPLTAAVPKPRLQYVNSDRLVQLRTLVDNAVKNHKVYSMTGSYNSVRNALKQRGWIEKIDSDFKGRNKISKFEEIGLYDAAFQFVQKNQTVAAMRLSMQCNTGFAHNDQIHYTGQGEAEIINRMLRNVTEDLCWLSRPYPYYCWKDLEKFEMVNRLPRAYFSNKVGLCDSLQQIQWFYESGVCSTQFPRTYNISMRDELEAFKEDFRLTACICILKWFLQTYKVGGERAVRSPEGKIDMNAIEFALRRCAEFVKIKQHEDIDLTEMPTVWEYQWDQFISQYYRVVNEGQILKYTKDGVSTKIVASNVQSMLTMLKPYWPQYDIEGLRNFWIVKPGGRCCGAGIVIKNNLEQILVIVNPTASRETRYVVQKYIERPLLIYNTKFDIRQWFLVTNVYPLTVWMYRESYLRFCSQPFTLHNTHESIHLCNNAVQRKYKNGKRDRGLPEENMWDCYTFQTYLKAIGHPDAWEKYIYPGMKEGFVGALLASQESMERKKNCFELYGADFMISETLTDGPWLIEINSNPAMDSSTSVTARMCPQVLEDIIKVVIDRRDNRSAPTGGFEMVYKQNCPPIPPYLGMSLCVKGKKAYKMSGDNKTTCRKSKNNYSRETLVYIDTEEESIGEEIVSVENSRSVRDTAKQSQSSSDEGNIRPLVTDVPEAHDNTDNGIVEKMENESKRRKVDWVQKNIDDLRSFHSLRSKPSICSSSGPTGLKGNFSPDVEAEFRTQVFRLLGSVEVQELLHELWEIRGQVEDKSSNKSLGALDTLVSEGIELLKKDSSRSMENDIEMNEETKQNLIKLLEACRDRTEEFVLQDCDYGETSFRITTKLSTKSCPIFQTNFEIELQPTEGVKRSKSEESLDTFFSATSCHSKPNSKTSLQYFREWKSKVSETRKTCEDMLSKLHAFQSENSKVKFQRALKKKIKDEVDFIQTIREYRKGKRRGREKNRTQTEKTNNGEEREKNTWKSEEKLTPLAINSETGAVRNINDRLPKIKQRSRPLLPNGSSGHGRKINVPLANSNF